MVDSLSVKHTVTDEAAVERTHPTFFPLAEQWETYTQAIQALRTGQAFIRLPNDTVRRVCTPTLPAVTVSTTQLAAIWQHYLATYFRPLPQSRQAGPQPIAPTPLSGAPVAPDATPAPAQATDTATTAKAEPRLEQPISRHRPDEPTSQHPRLVVWQQPGPGRRR